MKTIFVRKPNRVADLKGLKTKELKITIEKVVVLSGPEYQEFSQHLLRDRDFIADNRQLMRQDRQGVLHCLAIKAEDREDAILVESEGYEYPRYAAYIENLKEEREREQK